MDTKSSFAKIQISDNGICQRFPLQTSTPSMPKIRVRFCYIQILDPKRMKSITFLFVCYICSDETLFCVSSALICDGVSHCPSGDEYFSDEDAAMCARHKAITATNVSKTECPKCYCKIIYILFPTSHVACIRHQMVSHFGNKSQRNSSIKSIHRICNRVPQLRPNRPKNHIRRRIKMRMVRTTPMTVVLRTIVTMPSKQQRNAIVSHWRVACPNTARGAIWWWECYYAAVHYCSVFYGVSLSILLICVYHSFVASSIPIWTFFVLTPPIFSLSLTLSLSSSLHLLIHHFSHLILTRNAFPPLNFVDIFYNGAKLLDSSNELTFLGTSTNANLNGTSSSGDSTMPPNYDEIDPPPSYSTLFPGKSFEATASSTNESSTDAGEAAAAASVAVPAGSTSQLTSPTVFILPVVEIAASATTLTRSGT